MFILNGDICFYAFRRDQSASSESCIAESRVSNNNQSRNSVCKYNTASYVSPKTSVNQEFTVCALGEQKDELKNFDITEVNVTFSKYIRWEEESRWRCLNRKYGSGRLVVR